MVRLYYSKSYKLFFILTLIFLLVFYGIRTIYGLAFLHSSIGVVFSPYVHKEVNYEDISHDWASYSLSDIKVMAKLISTRFPMIVSYGIGSRWYSNDSDLYFWDTNYHQCYSQVHVSEAVAMLNYATQNGDKDSKGKDQPLEPLQVYQGVLIPASRLRVDLELFTAIEAIEKANNIFPGTITGIVFHGQAAIHNDYGNASLVFDAMKKVELRTAQYLIKLGTKQNCEGSYGGSDDLTGKRKEIILHSNFIICEVIPSLDMHVNDAAVWVIGQMKKFRKVLKTLNPWIDVMFETGWPAEEGNKTQIEELKTFWEYMEAWSVKNYVTLWMNEAFDTPWSYWERKRHWGWWKLKSDGATSKKDGYIEKIPHKGVMYTKQTKPKAIAEGKKFLEKLQHLMLKNETTVNVNTDGTEVDTEDQDGLSVPD